jgi:hypothetical protein
MGDRGTGGLEPGVCPQLGDGTPEVEVEIAAQPAEQAAVAHRAQVQPLASARQGDNRRAGASSASASDAEQALEAARFQQAELPRGRLEGRRHQ